MLNKKLVSWIAGIILVVFLAVFVLSSLAPFVAWADTVEETVEEETDDAAIEEQIKQKQEEQAEIQNKINEETEKKQGVLDAVEEMDSKISKLQEEINVLQSDIDNCNGKIADAEAKIAECEIKEQNQYESMKTRMRVMYEDNNTSYVTMIFGSNSLSDILTYVEIIKQIIDHDNKLYDRIVETKEKIKSLKKEIEDEKAVVVSKKEVADDKKGELNGEVDKMNETIGKINGDLESLRAAYEQAEKEERALKEQLKKDLSDDSGETSYDGGTFLWPTPGYGTITSQYGGRMHPTLKVYKVHTGMDIGAPMGATVVAGADGTVIRAEYNVAYGNYIVIDHGGGYSTLYAHNSALLVSKGNQVTRGQTIAKVGSTGYSTGPHCHFEVMINGQHTNPAPYLE